MPQLTRLTPVIHLTSAGQAAVSRAWGPGWKPNPAAALLTPRSPVANVAYILGVLAHMPPIVWAIAVVLFIGWRIDIELRPFRPCPQCGGSGRSRGSRPGAFGICPHPDRGVRFTARKAAQRHQRRRSQ